MKTIALLFTLGAVLLAGNAVPASAAAPAAIVPVVKLIGKIGKLAFEAEIQNQKFQKDVFDLMEGKNYGKGCYSACDRTTGFCAPTAEHPEGFCGLGGACCRAHWGDGTKACAGRGPVGYHGCSVPSTQLLIETVEAYRCEGLDCLNGDGKKALEAASNGEDRHRRLFMNKPEKSYWKEQCEGDCSGNCFGDHGCISKCEKQHGCASKPVCGSAMSPAPFQNMPGGVKCEAQPWGVIGDSKYFNRRLFMNDPANSKYYDQCIGDCMGNCFQDGTCVRACTAEHKCASKPRQHYTPPSSGDGPSGKDVANFIMFGKTRRLRGARA